MRHSAAVSVVCIVNAYRCQLTANVDISQTISIDISIASILGRISVGILPVPAISVAGNIGIVTAPVKLIGSLSEC